MLLKTKWKRKRMRSKNNKNKNKFIGFYTDLREII